MSLLICKFTSHVGSFKDQGSRHEKEVRLIHKATNEKTRKNRKEHSQPIRSLWGEKESWCSRQTLMKQFTSMWRSPCLLKWQSLIGWKFRLQNTEIRQVESEQSGCRTRRTLTLSDRRNPLGSEVAIGRGFTWSDHHKQVKSDWHVPMLLSESNRNRDSKWVQKNSWWKNRLGAGVESEEG